MQEDPERLAFEQVWPKKLVKGHKKRVFGVLSLVAVKSLKNPKMKEERGARMYLKRRVVERDTRVSVYRKCEYELWKWYWRNGESGSALQDRSTTETYIVRSIIFLIYGTSTKIWAHKKMSCESFHSRRVFGLPNLLGGV